jgi:hypothetical protein
MRFRSKRADPIDRAISDLDHQIATVQRELRELAGDPGRSGDVGHAAVSPPKTITRGSQDVLSASAANRSTPDRARHDLFDVGAEPLKDLEAEPIAFAHKPEPDLFAPATASGTRTTPAASTAALETAEVVPPQKKLAHYLGAGSIKSYKPLKHAQRQARNRFFMWLGLSFVALWIIWFVIR